MRQYELMVLLRPEVDPTDTKTIQSMMEKLLAGMEATVTDLTVMGKKRLAYPIAKHEEGVYAYAAVQAERLHAGAIEKQVKLGTDVVRYLLTAKK